MMLVRTDEAIEQEYKRMQVIWRKSYVNSKDESIAFSVLELIDWLRGECKTSRVLNHLDEDYSEYLEVEGLSSDWGEF